VDVALLAVPLEHLLSGAEICRGEGKVAFGSSAWEVFYALRERLEGEPCSVLIYASDEKRSGPPAARWRAGYNGFVEAKCGAHPDGLKYRPPSTAKYPQDNHGHWAVFWEVVNLREADSQEVIPIEKLRGLGNAKPFQSTFVPRGPILIEPW